MTQSISFEKDSLFEWKNRAATELKGRPPETLIWLNEAGVRQEAYYTKENSSTPYPVIPGPRGNTWDIFDMIPAGQSEEMNAAALNALRSGASALLFELNSSINLNGLLDQIELPFIQSGFLVPENALKQFLGDLGSICQERNWKTSEINGFIQVRIEGTDLQPASLKKDYLVFADEAEKWTNLRFVVDGASLREAGADPVYELAWTLFMAHELLLARLDKGSDVRDFCRQLQFNLSCAEDYFLEMARLRCVNHLWSLISSRYGDFSPAYLLSTTSRYRLTWLDANNNLLRNTASAMGAICGTSSGLLVYPHIPDGTNRNSRLARNLQLILEHEAHLDKVIDPAAGSYFIENLTWNVAERIWEGFLEMEEKGQQGNLSAYLEDHVKSRKSAYTKDVSSGNRFYLGVNRFPSKEDNLSQAVLFDQLRDFAPAGEMESLKKRVVSLENEPKVKLLLFGDKTMRKARAAFCHNFLACAAIKAEEIGVGHLSEELMQDTDLLILCSSDEEYLPFLESGKLLHPPMLGIAGLPSGQEELLRMAMVRYFIHRGSNIFQTITSMVNHLWA